MPPGSYHGEAPLESLRKHQAPVAILAAMVAIILAATLTSRAGGTHSSLHAGSAVPPPPAPPSPPPFTATDAENAFVSFNNAFYVVSHGRGAYKESTNGGVARFWQQAELIEMVEDAYTRFGRPVYKHMIDELYKGFVARYGTNWMSNRFNDDIMWMVLACLRAYRLTGTRLYLDQAKVHFDRVFARAWSTDLGGGLWWNTAKNEKNACVNAPAVIAAEELYEALHDTSYLNKALTLYSWLRTTLFDPATGAVADRTFLNASTLPPAQTVDPTTHSYNQGTFIGAAGALYEATHDRSYLRDGVKALDFTDKHLTAGGILQSEGPGDGGGFNGIFARWAVKFTQDAGIHTYDGWFQRNAAAAWQSRNSDTEMDQDWQAPTGAGSLEAFGCSSAVVMLQVSPSPTPPEEPVARPFMAAALSLP
jgi:predicted alpha-1,6-mannanase (GH76 family)